MVAVGSTTAVEGDAWFCTATGAFSVGTMPTVSATMACDALNWLVAVSKTEVFTANAIPPAASTPTMENVVAKVVFMSLTLRKVV